MDDFEIVAPAFKQLALPNADLLRWHLGVPSALELRQWPYARPRGRAADGVHRIDPSGALPGRIKVPSTMANLTFGGRNHSRLFPCASHTQYAIYVNVRGAHRP